MEQMAEEKFGETTGVLCVVNFIHRMEINCIGLTFLMQLQLKEMLADIIIKAMKEWI